MTYNVQLACQSICLKFDTLGRIGLADHQHEQVQSSPQDSLLIRDEGRVYTGFFHGEVIGMTPREDFDPLAPQREAAMFYGLFLRGHSADTLRRDIDVPRPLLEKWLSPHRYENGFRDSLRRVYQYRKQVLAIFDELVLNERNRPRLQ
jgi:hypothetical protein